MADLEALGEELLDDLGIRLAARPLHDLSDEGIHRSGLAPTDLLDDLGLRGDDLLDHGLELAGVRDLGEPGLLHDLRR